MAVKMIQGDGFEVDPEVQNLQSKSAESPLKSDTESCEDSSEPPKSETTLNHYETSECDMEIPDQEIEIHDSDTEILESHINCVIDQQQDIDAESQHTADGEKNDKVDLTSQADSGFGNHDCFDIAESTTNESENTRNSISENSSI